jgi:hypothetical protein
VDCGVGFTALGDAEPLDVRLEHRDEAIGPGRRGDVQRIDRTAAGRKDIGVHGANRQLGLVPLREDPLQFRSLFARSRAVAAEILVRDVDRHVVGVQ